MGYSGLGVVLYVLACAEFCGLFRFVEMKLLEFVLIDCDFGRLFSS